MLSYRTSLLLLNVYLPIIKIFKWPCICYYFSEFDALKPHDIRGNCKAAFDAGEQLGISRVIEPSDMGVLTIPDKLAVMTYLYQLRAHFTGKN